MAFLRQVVAPLLIVLVFLVALAAVSARIFLPTDMAAPAPIESVETSWQPPSQAIALQAGITSGTTAFSSLG